MSVTITESASSDPRMQRFLDREWPLGEPPPWLIERVVFIGEEDEEIIGRATARVPAGVAHLHELMVTTHAPRDGRS